MLTFFSFIMVIIGSFNWFFIASFQYDFVAGLFGSQASLLSRLIYFIIGISAFVLIAMAFKNKGKIKITENSFKQKFNKKENNEMNNNYEQNSTTPITSIHQTKTNSHNDYGNYEFDGQNEINDIDFTKKTKNLNQHENNEYTSKKGYKDFNINQYD